MTEVNKPTCLKSILLIVRMYTNSMYIFGTNGLAVKKLFVGVLYKSRLTRCTTGAFITAFVIHCGERNVSPTIKRADLIVRLMKNVFVISKITINPHMMSRPQVFIKYNAQSMHNFTFSLLRCYYKIIV